MPKTSRVLAVFEKQEEQIRAELDACNQRLADLKRLRQMFELAAAPKKKKAKESPDQTKLPGVA